MTDQEIRLAIAGDLGWKFAAHELIEVLRGEGWIVTLDNGLDGTWECTFTKQYRLFPQQQHYGAGDTFCRAVAQAYLKVRGKWQQEKQTA